MSDCIKLSDDFSLYTGDVITLRADDGTYLKRFFSLAGHNALFCYLREPDDFSYFVVEVVSSDKVRLIDYSSGLYCKLFCCWKNINFISMDLQSADPFSTFTIQPKGSSKITLQADNGFYLKRYFGYNGMSFIGVIQNQEDAFSVFKVDRVPGEIGSDIKEIVSDIKFDLDNLTQSQTPLTVGTQTLVNNSDQDQTMQFTVSKTVTTEKRFNWEGSIEKGFTVTAEFSCSVKIVTLGGKVEDSTTLRFAAGGSRSSAESQTFEATFPVNCRANTTMLATATVQLGKVNVPYKAKITRYLTDGNGDTTEYSYLVKGTYYGTNAFNLSYQLDELE